eukprot:1663900-Rhodomonas_salina.1
MERSEVMRLDLADTFRPLASVGHGHACERRVWRVEREALRLLRRCQSMPHTLPAPSPSASSQPPSLHSTPLSICASTLLGLDWAQICLGFELRLQSMRAVTVTVTLLNRETI